MACKLLDKIALEEPTPEYNDEFNEMDENEQDNVSYQESLNYIVDLEGYQKKQDEHHKKMGEHLKSCQDPECQEVRKNWQEEKDLAKYVN